MIGLIGFGSRIPAPNTRRHLGRISVPGENVSGRFRNDFNIWSSRSEKKRKIQEERGGGGSRGARGLGSEERPEVEGGEAEEVGQVGLRDPLPQQPPEALARFLRLTREGCPRPLTLRSSASAAPPRISTSRTAHQRSPAAGPSQPRRSRRPQCGTQVGAHAGLARAVRIRIAGPAAFVVCFRGEQRPDDRERPVLGRIVLKTFGGSRAGSGELDLEAFPGIEECPSDFNGMQFPSLGSMDLNLDVSFALDFFFLWGF
ncbi:hypothetical protein NL676_033655 [Syzygium grande]|nr:hypothetical protein NL676_033655 [Syzygium grande]